MKKMILLACSMLMAIASPIKAADEESYLIQKGELAQGLLQAPGLGTNVGMSIPFVEIGVITLFAIGLGFLIANHGTSSSAHN